VELAVGRIAHIELKRAYRVLVNNHRCYPGGEWRGGVIADAVRILRRVAK